MKTTGTMVLGMGFLLVTVAVGDGRQAPTDPMPMTTLAPMPVAVEQMPAPTVPRPLQINLQADLDASMFHGTVQAVNAAESSLTIRTDFGRTVVLFSEDCRTAGGLKAGDRVRLEPDAAGSMTVTPLDRRPAGGSLPEVAQPLSHLTWAPSRCHAGLNGVI